MKLKCNINGTEYDLVQGVTISEEYNETLDSATIIIDNTEKIENLCPYDDVFIYDDSKEFKGYSNSDEEIIGVIPSMQIQTEELEDGEISTTIMCWINKNELANVFSKTINSQDVELTYKLSTSAYAVTDNVNIYIEKNKYYLYIPVSPFKIEFENFGDSWGIRLSSVFSEAYISKCDFYVKRDEVEQPDFYKHFLVYDFTEERLNPVKNIYKYTIQLCSETKKLEVIQCPNISITQPLKQDLKKSVYTYIKQFLEMYNPIIKVATNDYRWVYKPKYTLDDNNLKIKYNNVYCPDLSLDNPSLKDILTQLFLTKDCIPYVKDDKIYALDITQRNGTFNTDNVTSITGSRSCENHADNLKRTYTQALSERNTARRVEFLGFRNSDVALMTIGNMRLETQFPIYKVNKLYLCYYKRIYIYKDNKLERQTMFLCKQDITKLVKQEAERNVLSQDWNDFKDSTPTTVDEMAQYKLCTVGYTIGDKKITGWGTSYTYPRGWWDVTATYLENIFNVLDKNNPFGIYTYDYYAHNLRVGEDIYISSSDTPLDNVVTIFQGSSRLKSFFFEMEYEAFYEGTIVTSKDENNRDDIVINDNSSSSLTLLEKDGLFQKEKINRYGNMAYNISAIYDNINSVQKLGSVYDNDVIIYHREYSIFENYVKASYYGTKDYVLKNYYTTVYSKHRPYALIDYDQSVKRAENRKIQIMLSKNVVKYEKEIENIKFRSIYGGDNISNFVSDLLSFSRATPTVLAIDKYNFTKKVNFGYLKYGGNKYACDMNVFVNGYSLCFNITMNDNISAGNYIRDARPSINPIVKSTEDDYTGSVQDFYSIVDSSDTGFAEKLGFYVGHLDEETNFNDTIQTYMPSTVDYRILALPKINFDFTEEIGNTYKINKDNKEVIDMTYQFECYSDNDDVFFSEWMLKLSELNGIYNKVDKTYEVKGTTTFNYQGEIYYGTGYLTVSSPDVQVVHYTPLIILKIPKATFNLMTNGNIVSSVNEWGINNYGGVDFTTNHFVFYKVEFREIVSKTSDKIGLMVYTTRKYKGGWFEKGKEVFSTETVYLTKVTKIENTGLDFSDDENNYYFTNFMEVNKRIPRETGEDLLSGSGFTTGWFGDGHNFLSNKTSLSDSGLYQDVFKLSISSAKSQKTYYKNMFVVTGLSKINKEIVYNSYSNFTYTSLTSTDLKVENVFTQKIFTNNYSFNGKPEIAIRVILDDIPKSENSVQMWFRDETSNMYYFVFGVNISSEDRTRGYIDIYTSILTRKDDRVFSQNNILVGKTTNFKDDLEYYGADQIYEKK